ncbi:MAG: stage II sporulation protein M, partial [Planctomycetales bacterium]|nr:stage II sporulation protein M [Planctomycetales bacterium]
DWAPPRTVEYLDHLVARAHGVLYRSRGVDLAAGAKLLFQEVPQGIVADGCFRAAFIIFWTCFTASLALSAARPDFAASLLGRDMLETMQESFSGELEDRPLSSNMAMAGFYIQHNTSIGLRCFAAGLLFGVGGLFATVYNALVLGATFGWMLGAPQQDTFYEFVAAHGPFELTAIVLCAAAGMRLGFALVDTGGYDRVASLQRAARRSGPVAGLAVLLFAAAAAIEAFVSPSGIGFAPKAVVSGLCSGMLMFYFVMLGGLGDRRGDAA